MFKPGAVQMPGALRACAVDASIISSDGIRSLLHASGVDSITKAFPEFNRADTLWISPMGTKVRLTDWSRIYTLRVPAGANRNAFIDSLNHKSEVAYAEPPGSVTFWAAPTYPNDSLFADGSQWGLWNHGQSGGAADADVDAPEAWATTTGGTNGHTLAIIDAGFENWHPDLSGKVSPSSDAGFGDDSDCPGHGFMVAGIAGANSANGKGIASLDWASQLLSLSISSNSTSTFIANQVRRASSDLSVKAINASWTLCEAGQGCNLITVKSAFMDAYKQGMITAAAMGNTGTVATLYPAAYLQGVIAVGAVNRLGDRWGLSTAGDHIDVMAPGVDIWSTSPYGSGYAMCSGTSLATPFVTGLAGLIRSRDPSLTNDDVENIIRYSADNMGDPGWDFLTGYGRVNAGRAVRFLDLPNKIASGVSTEKDFEQALSSGAWTQFYSVPGLTDGTSYWAVLFEVHAHVNFPTGRFSSAPRVWGRGTLSTGASAEVPNFGAGWCDVLPGSVDQNGCEMKTFFWLVDVPGQGSVWVPSPGPNGVSCAWFAVEDIQPDPAQSFYVPQAVISGGSVVEGAQALGGPQATSGFFGTCPNLDGSTVLRNNSRIKVVVKNASGNGIAGIPPQDIFVLFNAGTSVQGFIGDGADSVIANTTWTPENKCPLLRTMQADASTDASGSTYITFIGAGGQRDTTRKWGHYDFDMPVFALGTKIQGRLTSGSANGSYMLRIKNVDIAAGLTTSPLDTYEVLDSYDMNYRQGHPTDYWLDFTWDGVVNSLDNNFFLAHPFHHCRYPNNP